MFTTTRRRQRDHRRQTNTDDTTDGERNAVDNTLKHTHHYHRHARQNNTNTCAPTTHPAHTSATRHTKRNANQRQHSVKTHHEQKLHEHTHTKKRAKIITRVVHMKTLLRINSEKARVNFVKRVKNKGTTMSNIRSITNATRTRLR